MITGFTPKEILEAVLEENKELLEEALENELKTKRGNISKGVFYVRDFVRMIQPSDKTRQVWSNEIYEVEKV